MKVPAIRFLCITHTSAADTNGNRYHFARVVSTVTGRSLAFESGGEGNAQAIVGRAIGSACFPEVYNIERTIPKREWQGKVRDAERANGGTLEHTVTAEMILALEIAEAGAL